MPEAEEGDLEKLKALVASLGDDAERAKTVRAVRQFRDMAVEFEGMIGLVYVRAGPEDAQERIALLDPASSFFALAQLGASVPGLLATLLRAEADRDEAVTHIKTAIGSLDDPTGPHVVEDVRRVRDVVLLDALNALHPMRLSRTISNEEKASG